jgi:hypothetical protein
LLDPVVSGGYLVGCELSDIVLAGIDHVGDITFKVRRSGEVTDIVSHGVEDDVEHLVRIFVSAVFVCVYFDVCGTNDVSGRVCVNGKEVCNGVRMVAGGGDRVAGYVVVYVVSVLVTFIVNGVRKKTDFEVFVVLKVGERRTEKFGGEECAVTCESFGDDRVRDGLTLGHRPKFDSFVNYVNPRFSILVNFEGKNAVGVLDDGETGSGVETVSTVDGSDPTGNVTLLGVEGLVTVSVGSSELNHLSEYVNSPLVISNELIDISVETCSLEFGFGVTEYGLVENERVSAVEGVESKVTNSSVECLRAGAGLDGVGVYVLLIPPRLSEVDVTGACGQKVVSLTVGSNASEDVLVNVKVDGVLVTVDISGDSFAGVSNRFEFDRAVVKGFNPHVSFTNSNADCVGFFGINFLCGVVTVIFTVVTDDYELFAAEGNVFVASEFFFTGGVDGRGAAFGSFFIAAVGGSACGVLRLGGASGIFAGVLVTTCHEKNAKDHEQGKSQSQKSFHEKISF